MKINYFVRFVGPVLLGAALCLVPPSTWGQSPPSQGCCIKVPFPNSVNANVTVYYPTYLTADSSFTTTLPSGVGPIAAGTYPTWCVDAHTFIDPVQSQLPGTPYTGSMYSTCDPAALANVPTRLDAVPPVGPPPIKELGVRLGVGRNCFNFKT